MNLPVANARGRPPPGRNFRAPHVKSSVPPPILSSSNSTTENSNSSFSSSLLPSQENISTPVKKEEKSDWDSLAEESSSLPSIKIEENLVKQKIEERREKEEKKEEEEEDIWGTKIPKKEKIEKEKESELILEETKRKEETIKNEEKKEKEKERKDFPSRFGRELCFHGIKEEEEEEERGGKGYLQWMKQFTRNFLMEHYGKQGEKHIYLPLVHDYSISPFDFSTPSPDDLVFLARKQSFKQKKVEKKGNKSEEKNEKERQETEQERPDTISFSTQGEKEEKVPKIAFKKKKKYHKEEVGNQGETLSFKSSSSSMISSLNNKPVKQVMQSTQQRRKQMEEWRVKQEKEGRKRIAIGVLGGFNTGKSTLIGHLLHLSGLVTQQAMHKAERDSKLNGKPNYLFAYLLDELEEERKRFMTMDFSFSSLPSSSSLVEHLLIDTPGNPDFQRNTIVASYQSDVFLLVVDASPSNFESDFDSSFGQTKEMISIIRSLGKNQIGIAVNKMETVEWKQERYQEIVTKVGDYLKQMGMKEAQFWFVPVDSLSGENLLEPKNEQLKKWYTGPSLLQSIHTNFQQKGEKEHSKPLRFNVFDLYKSPALGGFAVIGKVETGMLSVGDKLMVSPQNQICTVKAIRRGEESTDFGVAGDLLHIGLQGIDFSTIGMGSILCDPERIVSSCRKIQAQILTYPLQCPILPGQIVEFHYLSLNEVATVSRLNTTLERVDSNWNTKKENPRMLTGQSNAIIEITFERPICLETASNFKDLSRFILRWNEKTIAAGIIVEILDDDSNRD